MTRRRKPSPVPAGFVTLPPVSKFFAALGKVYVRNNGSGAPPVYGLHVRPKHTNRHGTGHGGFLATLADTLMPAFIHHQHPEIGKIWTTLLTMEYRRPVPVGAWLECYLTDLQVEGDAVTVQCELRIGALVTNRAKATFKMAKGRDRQSAR